MKKQLKRLLVFGLSLGLVTVLSVPAFADGPRAADMDNAKDVWPGTAYDNWFTNAWPDANGVVTTPAGGGSSPLCHITVTGLFPDTNPLRGYGVFVDTDGGSAGPFVYQGAFTTDEDGNGQYRCLAPIGDGARVYIWSATTRLTLLISDEVVDD